MPLLNSQNYAFPRGNFPDRIIKILFCIYHRVCTALPSTRVNQCQCQTYGLNPAKRQQSISSGRLLRIQLINSCIAQFHSGFPDLVPYFLTGGRRKGRRNGGCCLGQSYPILVTFPAKQKVIWLD